MTRLKTHPLLLIALCAFILGASEPSSESPEALLEAGHWKKARAILEPRLGANSQDAHAAYLLSQVKMAFGDFDTALKLAQKAIALDDRNANHHYQLAVVYGEMADRASYVAALGLARKFKKELEIALALDPKNLDALDAQMQFCFQAPRLLGGDKNRARAIAEQISCLSPVRGYLAQAELAKEEKDTGKVEGFYLKALEADPKNYEAQAALADFYSSPPQKRYELAVMRARTALQLDAGRVMGYTILAKVFAFQEKWSELEPVLALAEKNVPDNLRPFFEAANTLLETEKNLAQAESFLRKYLTVEPEGNEPDAAHAHRLLGLVLEKLGRKEEARSELETAVRLNPGFEAAKEDLKRLGRSGR